MSNHHVVTIEEVTEAAKRSLGLNGKIVEIPGHEGACLTAGGNLEEKDGLCIAVLANCVVEDSGGYPLHVILFLSGKPVIPRTTAKRAAIVRKTLANYRFLCDPAPESGS